MKIKKFFKKLDNNWYYQELVKGLITFLFIISAFYITSFVFREKIAHLDKTIGGGIYQNINTMPKVSRPGERIENFDKIVIKINSSEYIAKYTIVNYGNIPLLVKGNTLIMATLKDDKYKDMKWAENIEIFDAKGSELPPIGILNKGEKVIISAKYKPILNRNITEYRMLCINFESTDTYYKDKNLEDCATIYINWI